MGVAGDGSHGDGDGKIWFGLLVEKEGGYWVRCVWLLVWGRLATGFVAEKWRRRRRRRSRKRGLEKREASKQEVSEADAEAQGWPGHVLPAPGRRLLPLAGFAPPDPGVRAPAPSPCRPPLLAVLCRATWGGWSGGFYFLCRGKRGQEIKMLAEPSSHQPQARLRRRAPRPRRQRLRGRGTFLRHPALPGHGPSVGPLGALRARASRPARPPVCLQSTGETGG